jgi:hypothetical protein
MATKPTLSIGTRVADRETGCEGVVIYLYEDPRLAEEIVAVKFDLGDVPVAIHVDDIRLARKPKGAR